MPAFAMARQWSSYLSIFACVMPAFTDFAIGITAHDVAGFADTDTAFGDVSLEPLPPSGPF
jgi:hypothetical protein